MISQTINRLKVDSNQLEWLYAPDFVYAEYGECKRHLQLIVPYQPVWNGEKYPLIIYIPGSAWYKQEMYNKIPILGQLARRGYVIAELEYRESTIAPFPAQVEDVKAAIRFLKSIAGDFHMDAENILLFGDSSGAHIALMTVLMDLKEDSNVKIIDGDVRQIKGIIDFSGPVNLIKVRKESLKPDMQKEGRMPVDSLLGVDDILNVPELAEAASCDTYISRQASIPPILIVHGTKDEVVSLSQSILLFEKLIKEKKEVYFYQLEDAGHGGAMFWCDEVLDIVDKFTQQCCIREDVNTIYSPSEKN